MLFTKSDKVQEVSVQRLQDFADCVLLQSNGIQASLPSVVASIFLLPRWAEPPDPAVSACSTPVLQGSPPPLFFM